MKAFICFSLARSLYLFFLVPVPVVQQVHVEGEGDVLDHHQAVRHSNPSQDKVDWIGPHVLVGQHQDVGHIK